jgi:uncharacterized phage protein (TIGR01671 family)
MNREIKFRAWDGKEMHKHSSDNMFFLTSGGETKHLFTSPEHPSYIQSSPLDWTLMQYTGLKDKNGKEIYEGDLVKGTENNPGGPSEVFYDIGQWQPFSYLGTWNGNDYEVIGNVYENPELLKS